MNNFYREIRDRLLLDDKCQASNNPLPILKLHTLENDLKWLVIGLNPFNQNQMIALSNYQEHWGRYYLPGIYSISFKSLEQLERKEGLTIVEDREFKGNFPISTYVRATEIERVITEDENILSLCDKRLTSENFSIKWDGFKSKKAIFNKLKF